MTAAILAANDILRQRSGREALQRTQHLQLFVAHRIRCVRYRRLHCDDAQQLQQVILQHVAQCARCLVIAHAIADAEFFRDRDLHIGDPFAAP